MPHNLDYTKLYKDTMWLQTTRSADNRKAETACLQAFSEQQQVKSCDSALKVSFITALLRFITALLQHNSCWFSLW